MQSGEQTIKLFSAFISINGEVCQAHQGSMCTFIRFAGCNLRCSWCDTVYAQEGGEDISVANLVKIVGDVQTQNVTITGGEPMMQKEALQELLILLITKGYNISVETNGSYDFIPIGVVSYVVDFKLPSSKEYDKMSLNKPFSRLRTHDWVKFVVKDRRDYEVGLDVMSKLRENRCHAQFAMSPMVGEWLDANTLVQYLKNDHIYDVVISVQLHKLLDLRESP